MTYFNFIKNFIKTLVVSLGNPIAFFVALYGLGFSDILIHLGGNIYKLSLKGMILFFACGFFYILIFTMFKKIFKKNLTFYEIFNHIVSKLTIISFIGMFLPFLFCIGMEGNVFGFIIALPAFIFSIIYLCFSLGVLFTTPKKRSD